MLKDELRPFEVTQNTLVTNIDREVGRRLLALRRLAQLTQEQTANGIGISFQQIQKYEQGENRIAVGRFYLLCKMYEVSPLYVLNHLEEPEWFDDYAKVLLQLKRNRKEHWIKLET